MNIEPIAYIRTDFKEKFGIPRQSGRVPSLRGRVVMLPEYGNPDALRGILDFSHLWLIFDFSRAHRPSWSPTVRPPRLGGNTRVGVFASRSPFRPNNLGLSCVKLVTVEQTAEGTVLVVDGVDMLDMTPIYDIKPYIPYADCVSDATGSYADGAAHHALKVEISDRLKSLLPDDKLEAVIACLADDPRPAYQDDPERIYSMAFADADISFRVEGDVLTVLDVRR